MHPEDIYEGVRSGVADAMEKLAVQRRVLRINEFDAMDAEGHTVRVVGIADSGDDDLKFVCMVEVTTRYFPQLWMASIASQTAMPASG